jgi:formylglycine-generating enzyme required for sulfatase activity
VKSSSPIHDRLPELTLIPAGKFIMGSDHGETDEGPAREVYLDEFLIAVRPVSQAEYARFVAETGYRAPAVHEVPLVASAGGVERERSFRELCEPYTWQDGQPPPGREAHPVTLVRWEDAAEYCVWLSAVTGRVARLPTEAEWEKAARGGADNRRYPWGERLDRGLANFLSDPGRRSEGGTTQAGVYPPNDYGLYDMAGNVWEWVQDWYDAGYYLNAPAENPLGPSEGKLRVVRGGSWLVADVRMLSCSHRHKVPPDTYSYAIGFRVACPV